MSLRNALPLDRRSLLAGAGMVMLAAGMPRVLLAKAPTDNRFILVVLRGAMDGLAAVPPYADRDYRELRGALALAEPGQPDGIIDLDGSFGLHPALKPLHDFYAKGQLAVLHAVATPYRDRSHFDGQDLLENGTTAPHSTHDGWLNRALALMGAGRTLGLAVGQSVPLVLRGSASVTSWAPAHLPDVSPDFMDKVADLYREDPVFGPALAAGLGDEALISKATAGTDMTAAGDPKMGIKRGGGGLSQAITGTVGKLLADPAGPRIAVIDVTGWDTHADQGTTKGRLAPVLAGLGDGLAGLATALGPIWRNTVVLTLTEFGRTAAINGTGGTDHGTGTAAFLMGGAVHGGRIIAQWPGLDRSRLYQARDLAPTTDTRAICKAVLRDHLGLPAGALDRVVFPDSTAVRPMADLVAA